ncbi:hypothetical protein [Ancylobacter lacus]|nr:hypothetical protein [Ancylobacter lacus]MBS7539490.1 hypothetical protein [Ancylobacter lacus]
MRSTLARYRDRILFALAYGIIAATVVFGHPFSGRLEMPSQPAASTVAAE